MSSKYLRVLNKKPVVFTKNDVKKLRFTKYYINNRIYLDADNMFRLLHFDYVDDLIIDLFSIIMSTQMDNNNRIRIMSASTYYPGAPDDSSEDTLKDYFEDTDVTLIPVNLNRNHWILVKYYNGSRNFQVYDSLQSENYESIKIFLSQTFDVPINQIQFETKDVVQQNNGIDCGLYVMFYIYCIIKNYRIPKRNRKYRINSEKARPNILSFLLGNITEIKGFTKNENIQLRRMSGNTKIYNKTNKISNGSCSTRKRT